MQVELTQEQCSVIVKIMDQVPGLENARLLLPIYDAIKRAVEQDIKSSNKVE